MTVATDISGSNILANFVCYVFSALHSNAWHYTALPTD